LLEKDRADAVWCHERDCALLREDWECYRNAWAWAGSVERNRPTDLDY
jgi:hypothetical protein